MILSIRYAQEYYLAAYHYLDCIFCLITVIPICLSASKPSVPEFTLKYIDRSYDTKPAYSIDPYTGQSVITDPSHHIKNQTIEITIKNQPFSPSKDASGNWTSLYYDISFKGHYENEWDSFPHRPNHGYVSASSSDYTIISFGHDQLGDVSVGGQIDVQVVALIGHDNEFAVFGTFGEGREFYFTGEASDWSSIQTVTIGDESPVSSTMPSPSATNTDPSVLPSQDLSATPLQPNTQSNVIFGLGLEQVAIVVLVVLVAVLAAAFVYAYRKRSTPNFGSV